ncbi:hypothetical protein [Bythopirellula goksoeyrii]|uniref:Uncharacterized protein n=1 Tax=Bythopirellula goksoeyrii TaxID=1400387 RepID=A0A5B9QTD1_9BACT|nr:hypothetical protein [Bythopirellula goksoeyrii]QEG37183.1 hypothetical protein Pr1d_45240 [Bythopirellula goksoeyrii]
MMPVPAAKVKEVCSTQEAKLVRSSRRPELGKLTPSQVKQHAARARKLYEKWLALSREQSRAKSKKTGFGDSQANTKLKVEIFGDALKSFEAELAKIDPQSTPKKKAKTKKARSAGHRAARAEVRAKLRAEVDSEKESSKASVKKKAKKKAAKESTTKELEKTAKKKSASSKKKVSKKSTKKISPASNPTSNPGLTVNKKKSRKATTAAKKARISRSGLTSRVAGHVSARGKRAQAARDSRN